MVGSDQEPCPVCKGSGRPTPVLVRLAAKIDRVNGDIPAHNPSLGRCWEFLGARTTKGHGVIRDDAGNLAYAHRIALAAALGRPIAPGMLACHKCDNKPCVRPSHLYEGSKSDNEQDKWTYSTREPRGDLVLGLG